MEEENEASPDWVRITLRMTPQQRDLLRRAADAAGMALLRMGAARVAGECLLAPRRQRAAARAHLRRCYSDLWLPSHSGPFLLCLQPQK